MPLEPLLQMVRRRNWSTGSDSLNNEALSMARNKDRYGNIFHAETEVLPDAFQRATLPSDELVEGGDEVL